MNVTAFKNRLARKEALLEKAYDQQERLLDSQKESASLDSGDGRTAFKNRSLEEVDSTISRLEADIRSLEQRLNKTGVVMVGLRRHC